MPRGKPIKFHSLAEAMREYIRTNHLENGDSLPSAREWSKLLGANHLTIRKALHLLESEGAIHTIPSRGSFVGPAHSPLPRTGLLGFVFPDEEFFFYEILTDLERKVEPLGMHPLVHVTHQSEATEARVIEYFKTIPMVAVIAAPNVQSAQLYHELRCPVVFFDTLLEGISIPQVTTDDTAGAQRATEHLTQLGHRHIAHIGGLGEPTSHLRLQGYLNALTKHDMPIEPRLIRRRNYSREWGYEATKLLFQESKTPPTALFCGNDTLAVGALRCLKDLNIPCPQKVSVVGFGDTEIAADLDLTTVEQPRSLIVDAILQNLRALLNRDIPTPVTSIATRPILRGTTAPAPH